MSYTTTQMPIRILSLFLDELSASHGDPEIDAEIIGGIVDGWVKSDHQPSKEFLAQKLIELAEKLTA